MRTSQFKSPLSRRRKLAATAALLTITTTFAACSSDDDTDNNETSASASESTQAEESPEAPEADNSNADAGIYNDIQEAAQAEGFTCVLAEDPTLAEEAFGCLRADEQMMMSFTLFTKDQFESGEEVSNIMVGKMQEQTRENMGGDPADAAEMETKMRHATRPIDTDEFVGFCQDAASVVDQEADACDEIMPKLNINVSRLDA